jgi:hypothetical protein
MEKKSLQGAKNVALKEQIASNNRKWGIEKMGSWKKPGLQRENKRSGMKYWHPWNKSG